MGVGGRIHDVDEGGVAAVRPGGDAVKFCSVCGEPKAPGQFYRDAKNRDGLSNRCRDCNRSKKKRPAGYASGPISADAIPDPDVDVAEFVGQGTAAACKTDVLLTDVHAPDAIDVRAWRCSLEIIRALKPERVIILGDFIDGEAFSRHVPMSTKDGLLELAGAVKYLEQLRETHKGPLVFLEGNHEQWPQKWAQQGRSQVASLLLAEELLECGRLGITYVPESRQPWRVAANLIAVHGHQLFASMPPKYHARKAIEGYSSSLVYGHTHRPDYHQTERVPHGVVAAYGLGCLRDLKPEWNKGPARSSAWAHGIGIVERDATDHAHVYMVSIHEGRAVYGGREFVG